MSPLNLYEQTLEDLGPRAPQAVEDNPYAQTLKDQTARDAATVRTAQQAARQTTPDRAAEASRLSELTGLPPEVIDRNFEDIQKRVGPSAHPYAQMLRDTPALASWMAQPQNAAVAQDDVSALSTLEWYLTAPGRAFAQTWNRQEYGTLRYREMLGGTLTPTERDYMNSVKFNADQAGDLGVGDSYVREAFTGLGSFLANQGQVVVPTIKGMGYGATAGLGVVAAGGAAVFGLPVAGLVGVGGAVGQYYGLVQSTNEQEAANAYDEFLTFRDEVGRPLDPAVARMAALAVGAINAPIEAGAQELLLKYIPGLNRLSLSRALGLRTAVKTALRSPTVRAALGRLALNYGKTLAGETAQEVGQRGVAILLGELAKTQAFATPPGQTTPGNINLYQQPRVQNPDGTLSTVDSLSVNLDGREVLLPTVTPEGQHFTGTPEARMQQAVAEYQRTGRHLGIFATPADATAFAEQLHADYAAGTYDQPGTFRTASDILQDLGAEAVGAATSFALPLLAGPALSAPGELRAVRQAKAQQAWFTALGDGVKDSKTFQRLPEAAQAYLAHVTKDGPVENLYLDPETFTTYWQSKGVDPATMAATLLGNAEAYPEAVRTGEPLVIPTAAYAVKIAPTEHNAFFARELRFGPGLENVREQEANAPVRARLFDEAMAAALAEPVPPAPTAAQQADPIYTNFHTQLIAAGQSPAEAHQNATVVARAYQTLGQRADIDPQALFARRRWMISGPLDDATIRAREAAREAAPVAPTGEPGTTASVPFMITRQMEADLRAAGYDDTAINQMTPADAHTALAARQPVVPSAEAAHVTDVTEPAPAAASATGPGPADVISEQPRADAGGVVEGRGDGDRVERGGLPAAPGVGAVAEPGGVAAEPGTVAEPGAVDLDAEVFTRQSAEQDTARLTPEVQRELRRLDDELETFPYVPRTWNWLEGPKTGNAAGGAAEIVAGEGGAPVYYDILYLSPVNRATSGRRKGQPAREARGSRAAVRAAITQVLETGAIRTNLAEGAVRVAERRAAGDWKELSKPALPHRDGPIATVALTDALSDAIDDSLAANPELAGEADVPFDPAALEAETAAPAGEVPATGEMQPPLPGAEAVRETEQATPEFDAPFSLTPEAAPVPGIQKPFTFEQAALGTLRGFTRAVAPWLTEDERGRIIMSAARRAIAIHQQLPHVMDFVHAALAGQVKRHWYKQAARALQVIFGEKDAPRFAALLAALSPQNPVEDDLTNTLRVWVAWKELSPEAKQAITHDSLRELMRQVLPATLSGEQQKALPAWVGNALIALTATDPTTIQLSGPKVNSFYANLIGHWHEVTNDSWMAAFAGLKGDVFGGTKKTARRLAGKTAIYYAYSAKVRQAAALLTERTGERWTPDEVQAAVWAWTWTLADLSKATKLTPAQVITQGLLTDDAIAETPDFAALLQNHPEIRGILEAAQYGPELDALAAEFAPRLDDQEPGNDRVVPPSRGTAGRGRGAATRRRDVRERIASLLRSARRLTRNRVGEPRTLYQSPVTAPTFYSRLTRAVELSTLAKATGAQWQATIRNAKIGINQDEFAYARVEDLEADRVYTQADVLAYLGANTLTLEDVTLSEVAEPLEADVRTLAEELYEAAVQERLEELEQDDEDYEEISSGTRFNAEQGAWEAQVDGEDLGEWFETKEEAEDAIDVREGELRDAQQEARGDDLVRQAREDVDYDEVRQEAERQLEREFGDVADRVRYAEYVEPGAVAGSYREVFLTAPQIPLTEPLPTLTGLTDRDLAQLREAGFSQTVDAVAERLATGRVDEARARVEEVIASLTGLLDRGHAHPDAYLHRRIFQKLEQNLIWDKVAKPVTWEDGHDEYSDIPNPVVRLRFNERTVPGPPIERRRVIRSYHPFADRGDPTTTRYRVAVEGAPLVLDRAFDTLAEAEAYVVANPTYADPTTKRMLFLEEAQPPHEDQPMPPLLRKHWREIAFKWVLRYAAEQGFDVLGWTTGAMQAARYSLEKQVERIAWGPGVERGEAGTHVTIKLIGPGGRTINFHVVEGIVQREGADAQAERWAGAPLENVIGKEVAATIVGERSGELAGEGLKIGGAGLKRLYDADFRAVVNKLPAVKAAGVRVTTAPLRSSDVNANYDITETSPGVWRLVDRRDNLFVPAAPTFRRGADAEQWLRDQGKLDVNVPAIDLTPAIKAAVLGGQPLFQPAPEGPRAAVTFTPGAVHVQLFAGADKSSFLHEGAHVFLEVMGDLADELRARDPATLTPTQQKLVADYDAALQWLGVTHRGQIAVAHHEQFARGFEAYLREGKAPSTELRSTFAQFRSWLLVLYQSLTQLDVVLTPEVRAVFDRMLASDEAIAEAEAEPAVQPLFTTAESAGMSRTAFAQYQALVQAASDQAKAELSARLYRDWERERAATWMAARERIRAAVTAEVQQEPVYRARAAIRTGTHPDGTPLVEGQPPTPIRITMNPLLPAAEGEISLDTAAEFFGFPSGDALAHALRTAPTERRVIAAKTYARLRAELGDVPLQRAVLREKADETVYGAARQVVVQAELKALTAGMQRGVIPPPALIRQHARERIRATRVRDLRPGIFLVTAQRASQRAFDLKESDRAAAVQAKQQELVNLALYREAIAAKDAAAQGARWVRAHDREAARGRLGKAGASYVEQWDKILERFEFKPSTLKALDKRAALSAWVAGQQAQNLPVAMPALLLDEAQRTNYQNLTVDQLTQVLHGLQHLVHLARLKGTLLTAQKQRAFEANLLEATASIRANHEPRRPVPEPGHVDEKLARTVEMWFASHKKLAFLIRALDGWQTGGVLWNLVTRVINAAGDREAQMNHETTLAVIAIFDGAYSRTEQAHLRDKLHIPAIDQSLSKEARLMVAFNWGNEGNRQRTRDGRHWTDAQVAAILDTLDQRDWVFVQSVFDYVDSFRPEIAAKHQRVTGLPFEAVEATPIQTTFGTFRGGYFPLAYDRRLSERTTAIIDPSTTNLQKQASYTGFTTRHGHEETRQEWVGEPVRLEFSVLYEHLEQVIHDLSHHEALIDVGRLIVDPRMRAAIVETHGDVVYQQIKGALTDIAYGARAASNIFDKAFNFMRHGGTVSTLGWNSWTGVSQLNGMWNGMRRVKPKYLIRALTRMLRDVRSTESAARWVHANSTMMKFRDGTRNREINELRNKLTQTGTWFDLAIRAVTRDTVTAEDLQQSFFWFITAGQGIVDVAVWLGAYEQYMDAMPDDAVDEPRAKALADQAVLDTQGGGQIKDLSLAERGIPAFKLFTMFYMYGNVLYQQNAEAYGEYRRGGSTGQFLVNLSLVNVFPAITSVLLAMLFMRDDDDEGFWEAVGREMIGNALNTMIFVREAAGLVKTDIGRYGGPPGTRLIQRGMDLYTQVRQLEADKPLLRAAEDVAGIIFKLPLGQIQRSIDGFTALVEGRTKNPLALLTGAPKEK